MYRNILILIGNLQQCNNYSCNEVIGICIKHKNLLARKGKKNNELYNKLAPVKARLVQLFIKILLNKK